MVLSVEVVTERCDFNSQGGQLHADVHQTADQTHRQTDNSEPFANGKT
jgi:hypothetical protein